MTLQDFYDIDVSNLSTMDEKEREKVLKLATEI